MVPWLLKGDHMHPDWIDRLASAGLVAMLVRQILKQLHSLDESVSQSLFVGLCATSAGFVVYRVLLHNWVFIVTKSCVLLTAVAGQMRALWRQRAVGACGKN